MRGIGLQLGFIVLIFSSSAQSGWLFSGSTSWGVFALRPLGKENSPNYYGIAPDITAGYSFWQSLDIAGYLSYVPGKEHKIHFGEENASFVSWGAELGLRFEETLYFGFFVGKSRYHLVKATTLSEQTLGQWEGASYGFSMGTIFRETKRTYWELLLRIFSADLDKQKPETIFPVSSRKADAFLFGIGYTFNSFYNTLEQNSIFKNVL